MLNESDSLHFVTSTVTNETILYQIPPWVGNVELGFWIVIILIGVPGNFLTICVQFRNKDKSSTDYMILMMAGYELVCSSSNVIFKIMMNLKIWQSFSSDILCRFNRNVGYITTLTSTYLLAGIAVDRYIKTCKPLSNICNVKTSKITCVVIAILGYIGGIPSYYNVEVDENYLCKVSPKYRNQQLIWDMCLLASNAVILVIVAFTYSSIAITLRQRTRTKKSVRKLVNVSLNSTQESKQGPSNMFQKLRRNKVEPMVDVEQSASGSSGAINPGSHLGEREVSIQNTSFSNYRVFEEKPIQYLSAVSKQPATLAEDTVNRTTGMLFILTVIYAVAFTSANLLVLTANSGSSIGIIMAKFGSPLLMINCISNPICFFCMSSKYRTSAKRLLFRHRRAQRFNNGHIL